MAIDIQTETVISDRRGPTGIFPAGPNIISSIYRWLRQRQPEVSSSKPSSWAAVDTRVDRGNPAIY